MEIREIKPIQVRSTNIIINEVRQIPNLPNWLTSEPPRAIPIYPPVTGGVGVPIIDMPGCVEAHQEDDKGKNEQLSDDDPKGVRVFCDAGMPAFDPMDFNKEKLEFTGEAAVPPVNTGDPPPLDTPEIPGDTAKTAEIKCPTEAQQLKEPIGTLVKDGREKIIEYRLVGKECIAISEEIGFVDQVVKGIPSANQVATTGGIAIVATAAATATPILLKVVKPIVKQIFKKVQKLLGKEPPKLSASEIRADKYREKKGLPPVKRPKKKK